jgi:hypothetical protein
MSEGFVFFTQATARTFRAAAACIVPSDEKSAGADSDRAVAAADRAIFERPERDRRLLTIFLKAVELLPIFRYGRTFSHLAPAQRSAFLAFLENTRISSKLRQGFFGLKTFALLGHYTIDETWSDLGYPGPRLDAPYYATRDR